MRYVFAALAALLLCAHSWYEPACCSGQDCFELPKRDVTATRTGYNVVIRQLPPQLGGGALNPPLRYHVVHSNTKPSGDDSPHACLRPQMSEEGQPWTLICLYVPAEGV